MNPLDDAHLPDHNHHPHQRPLRPDEPRGPFRLDDARSHTGEGRGSGGTTKGRQEIAEPASDELDALAELFLGPEGHAETGGTPMNGHAPRARRDAQAKVEGLVLGHLPIFAAAWASQYARHLADERGGPVAVVRLASGTLSVELFGGDGAAEPESASAGEALARAGRAASLVLLRVDEPAEAELVAAGLDSLRLLSGTDDAAVVACYRKLKGLGAAAEDAGAALPALGLAMMGAGRDRALEAHARIAKAARAFLEARLAEAVIVERIAPTGANQVFRGESRLTLAEVIAALRASEADAGRADAPEFVLAVQSSVASEPVDLGETIDAGAPGSGEVRHAGGLCALIDGLRPLESRCPGNERVELAVDRDGRLHLVVARLAAHAGLSSTQPLRDLIAAAAWARTHRTLLGRAEPGLAGESEACLHLVTDRRDDARALLGTAVRVHLAFAAQPAPMGFVAVSLED